MLTRPQYENLWESHFSRIVPAGILMPDYCEYLNREHMVEDYLDIFRGVNTRSKRPIQPCNKKKENNSNQILPTEEWYYPHPFFDEKGEGNIEKPLCIKYMLIAEACPEGGANYFYDINEIINQGYLKAAYDAIYNGAGPSIPWVKLTKTIDKVNSLLDLAKRGVLLLDIFPFAIKYTTTTRNSLNLIGATNTFWNGPNPASIQNRLNTIANLLFDDWDLCMIAPPNLSLYILNSLLPIVVIKIGVHIVVFKNIYAHRKRSKKSNYQKFAVNSSNINPDTDLITIAFI